jgi:hypothetical protein
MTMLVLPTAMCLEGTIKQPVLTGINNVSITNQQSINIKHVKYEHYPTSKYQIIPVLEFWNNIPIYIYTSIYNQYIPDYTSIGILE